MMDATRAFSIWARDASIKQYLDDAEASRKNKELLERMLKLRHESAGILGHPHWASYNAEDKMAGSAETIAAFIDDVVFELKNPVPVESMSWGELKLLNQ